MVMLHLKNKKKITVKRYIWKKVCVFLNVDKTDTHFDYSSQTERTKWSTWIARCFYLQTDSGQ